MSGHHFQIVRTAAGFHSRFVASNGKIMFTTEPYLRRRAAVAAIERICAAPVLTSPFADHPEVMWAGSVQPTEVRDVDERPEPPVPATIEPPYFVGRHSGGFWHDSDYHSRNCYGDDCTQGTPPAGADVRGRTGLATYTERTVTP